LLRKDGALQELFGDPTVGQRLDHRSKNGRSKTKNGTPEKLRCRTIQKEVGQILQLMIAGAARRRILPFYLA